MKKIFIPERLKDLIYKAPDRVDKKIKDIANELGVSEKYLSRQLNPIDTGAKLGVEEFVYLLAHTDLKPLEYINSIFDRISIPISDKKVLTQTRWLKHISSISKEAGEAVAELAKSITDNNLSKEQVSKCKKETYEALQSLSLLWIDLKRYEAKNG